MAAERAGEQANASAVARVSPGFSFRAAPLHTAFHHRIVDRALALGLRHLTQLP